MAATTIPTGVRARKKHATSVALREAALELFLEHSYSGTTVEQIANRAGVSPRTFFRYYATKDDVMFGQHEADKQALREFLNDRPDESLSSLMAAVGAFLAGRDEEQPEQVRMLVALRSAAPQIMHRYMTFHEELVKVVSDHVATRLGVDSKKDLRPAMVGGTAIRAWLAATEVWVSNGVEGQLSPLVTEALGLIHIESLDRHK
jgi:AcrR family transcriptional regulator